MRPARACAALLLSLACAGESWHSSVARDHPLVGTVWDVRAGAPVAPAELEAALAPRRFVLLGEKHDNADHHRLQARLVTALAAAGRGGPVALEMLRLDTAPALAEVLARPDVDAAAVREAVAWDASGWPDWALYAPIAEAALAAGLPLVAADLPRATQTALGRGGAAALAPDERQRLGFGLSLSDAQRRDLAEEIRDAHCGHAPEAMVSRMIDVQRARDAQLARSLMAAASGAPGAAVVLVTGAEHARRDRGVPLYLAAWAPEASLASVLFAEVDPEQVDARSALADRYGERVPFDYVWWTPRVDLFDPCVKFRRELEVMEPRLPDS